MKPRPLRRGIRIGALRAGATSSEFRPIATLSFVRDGGIHITPAEISSAHWRYGRLVSDQRPSANLTSITMVRPKLHYHNSGFVSVSQTGTRLPTRSVQYPPLHTTSRSQFLSVFAVRPWELPVKPFERAGDFCVSDNRWPWIIGFSFALVAKPKGRSRLHSIGDRGLLSGDRKRFFVDLTQFGRSEILIGHAHVTYDAPARAQVASVTVSAYPRVDPKAKPQEIFALWNDGTINPLAVWEPASELLGAADLNAALGGRVRTFSTDDLHERARTLREVGTSQTEFFGSS